jgi:cobalt-zinc-cadmium efflux system outer membrane protein
VPDVEVRAEVWKETTILPKQNFLAASVSIPFPLWDKNRGGIRAASAAMVRAAEGPHQAEVALTTGLAAAYSSYKSNLAAVEYYRRYILPDQVRYYRGVFERRQIDPNASIGDLVQAQQTLAADVTAYLGVLGTLWTSVVNVANYLQTDDLYQLGPPLELPRLPDLETLNAWPCPHPQCVPPTIVNPPAPGPGHHTLGAASIGPAATLALGPKIDGLVATAIATGTRDVPTPGPAASGAQRSSPEPGPESPPGMPAPPAAPTVAQPSSPPESDLSRRPGAASR